MTVSTAAMAHELKAAIMLFHSLLDEKQRRLHAGLEAFKLGHGGDQQIADLLGLDRHTVANGCRARVFKWRLHCQLRQAHQVTVTLCHYPPGASKWNPIEHRPLFRNQQELAEQALGDSGHDAQLHTTTSTKSGLDVDAHLLRRKYTKGERVPDKLLQQLPLSRDPFLPDWNYTIAPTNGEVIFS